MKTMGKVLIGVLLTILSCSKTETVTVPCIDKNCGNYTSQAAAQADFISNPECRRDLDADKDGIACEEPGNTVKTCLSTSNCGCSGKTKSVCGLDPCCQWIVGTGCKCK
ncbi:MAG: excalibur calcium-binding domain-containing protein [Spirosomataceae bacterium]